MVPDRLSLQNMEKLPNETFRQYAQRWRDLATQVQPPLTEKKTTVMFINTLKGSYYKKMVGNATRNFADMVISGEMIESAIKNGKMGGEDAGSSKKVVHARKKDGEVHMVGNGEPHLPNPYPYQPQPMYNPYYPPQYPYYPMPSQPMVAANYSQPTGTQNQNKAEPKPPRQNTEGPKFAPIPMSYTELYPKLLQAKRRPAAEHLLNKKNSKKEEEESSKRRKRRRKKGEVRTSPEEEAEEEHRTFDGGLVPNRRESSQTEAGSVFLPTRTTE